MPAIEDSRPDPNEYYESYLDPEEKDNKSPNSSGIERKAKAVYSDQNSRQANLSAYAAKNPPQAMQRKIEGVPTLDFQAMIGSLEGKKAEAAAADQKAVLVAQAAV